MTLDELQSRVDGWIETNGGYYDVLTNLARLLEEAGEVAHILARTDGQLPTRAGQRTSPADLEGEFGDLMFVIACLANQKQIKLGHCIESALAKYEARTK